MFEYSVIPELSNLTLEAFIERLKASAEVDGIVLLGTTKGSLADSSDHDIGIVLTNPPIPLWVGLTSLDGRLTDLIFLGTSVFESLSSLESAQDSAPARAMAIRMLMSGAVVFDRRGLLHKVADQALQSIDFRTGGPKLYHYWFKVNYDRLQNARMVSSEDPDYRHALALRLAYSVLEAVVHYFDFRGLEWLGEKNALRYLRENDRKFYRTLVDCLSQTDLDEKFKLYEELAELSTEPVGGLAPAGATILEFQEGYEIDAETVSQAHAYFKEIVGHGKPG